MPAQLYVCNGCCCGRNAKGNLEVPIEALKEAWQEHQLSNAVKLNISTCLGPCSRGNVTMLKHEEGRTWLGNLHTAEHYEALVEWAQHLAADGSPQALPPLLQSLHFTPT